jgi:hypothetical protein
MGKMLLAAANADAAFCRGNSGPRRTQHGSEQETKNDPGNRIGGVPGSSLGISVV